MFVRITFRQRMPHRTLAKDVELYIAPRVGDSIEYQEGWGLEEVKSIAIYQHKVLLDYYGPQFTPEEVEQLVALGWEIL